MNKRSGVVMTVAAPLTPLDYQLAYEQLEIMPENQWRRLQVEVDSVAVALSPGCSGSTSRWRQWPHMRAVAVASGVEWFSSG